ncbi:Zinc finger BED domain-containing protein 5 [Eumeta japonica]|uniref:Zinc finger BED domain-containing protein 5 n=1 Tax=Eumeta variegata TaxID=151549 RepID=A0A4C1VCD6_EUMVA|nr:Zinc finger BED domain-containing protein 5 [Eumeta japonica]
MDDSTDVTGLAILLVIVRYPYESSFEEDMRMCSPLPTNTTREEIFNKINIFFEENNLSWNDCIDICTDGIKAMTVSVEINTSLPLMERLRDTLCPLALWGRFDGLFICSDCYFGLGHEPHSTNLVFGRHRRRTPLTQIVSQISATTFELVKPVINSGKG